MIKLGLIGEKLTHSYSKMIHNYLGLEYSLISLNNYEFKDFMERKEFVGINVTIPYKEKVIPYLSFCDHKASRIQAVNTVINDNGQLRGYNTDYEGFRYLLIHEKIEVENKKVLVLGTGGTSKTIACVLDDLGAKKVYFASRMKKENAFLYEEIKDLEVDILVNATPVGMFPNVGKMAISLDQLKGLKTVVDVIYNPYNTQLMLEAKKRKIKAVNGLSMLVYQALSSIELFLNKRYDKNDVERITKKLKFDVLNLVLIGMPGSGKTTLANQLALKTGKRIVDIDFEITEAESSTITDVFNKKGEKYFRDLETKIIKEQSTSSGIIIATGGGAVLKEENMDALKANGLLIYVDRDIENIILDDKRPLSQTKEDLKRIYNERKDLYEKYADFIVKNNNGFSDVVDAVLNNIT
ncbi:MAG: shikimate kinase [Bacilli bacterium]|jgi:shikimate dehydrogenase